MPIAPTVPVGTGVTPDHTTSGAPPAGFDDALTAQRAARGPAVSIGEMLAAYGGASAPPSAVRGPTSAAMTSLNRNSAVASGRSPQDGPGAEVLAAGERYLGVPYVWGGTDADTGFDCSGFVQQAFDDVGIALPRVSRDQARAGTEVGSLNEARPGDLVYWQGSGSRPNHIGIYAGQGRMLVAPSRGDVVRYQDITRTPDAIRRVL